MPSEVFTFELNGRETEVMARPLATLVHARINGIDFSAAEKVPGFVSALTAADVPKNVYTILCLIGVEPDEEQVLAAERARYRGEPIAAIVAESEEAAVEAVSRVSLDLEELPAG